jgi:predicted MPP superfamily phosphohydrolase
VSEHAKEPTSDENRDYRRRLSIAKKDWQKLGGLLAAAVDLICIGGDFLDLFDQEPKPKQVSLVQSCLRRLAAATTIAICSGNHDSFGPIVPAARGPTYPWLVELDEIRGHNI